VGAGAVTARPGDGLEERALEWIAPYWNARHLVRTRDWVLELDPDASHAVRLAALTHDIERHFPGGPRGEPGDPAYERAHAERSALIVADWLTAESAAPELVAAVRDLVRAHEEGGWPEADLLQAADSLSFLEVNVERPVAWVREGRCDLATARARLGHLRDRIKPPRAREAAAPLLAEAERRLLASVS
jgi:hypothetical protein